MARLRKKRSRVGGEKKVTDPSPGFVLHRETVEVKGIDWEALSLPWVDCRELHGGRRNVAVCGVKGCSCEVYERRMEEFRVRMERGKWAVWDRVIQQLKEMLKS